MKPKKKVIESRTLSYTIPKETVELYRKGFSPIIDSLKAERLLEAEKYMVAVQSRLTIFREIGEVYPVKPPRPQSKVHGVSPSLMHAILNIGVDCGKIADSIIIMNSQFHCGYIDPTIQQYAIISINMASRKKSITFIHSSNKELYQQEADKLEIGIPIKFLNEPSNAILKLANRKNLYKLFGYSKGSELLQQLAVTLNPSAIEHIKDPSIEVQKRAVFQDGHTLKFITNPSMEVCILACVQDASAFKYVPRGILSIEFCMLLIKYDFYAVLYIPEELKTRELYSKVLELYPEKEDHIIFYKQQRGLA